MKRLSWQVKLGLFLISLAILLDFVQYLIFGEPRHIFLFIMEHVAFIPVEVLLITLIIHGSLNKQEKRERIEKLHVIVEAFFSEVGKSLLTCFSDLDPSLEQVKRHLVVNQDWSARDFSNARMYLDGYDYKVEIKSEHLQDLRQFLFEKRGLLLGLLQSPAILEHEFFTDLLLAISHLTEELAIRENLEHLPSADYEHLMQDVKRVYTLLIRQWVDFIEYLKENYPYLFSISVRTNPFDKNASPVVTGE